LNLPFHIARRYLFSKKSTNAINIISGISVFGLSVGAAALVLVLSVFNGFEDLITGLFSNFNPDIKVLPAKGKTFLPNDEQILKIKALEDVEHLSLTLEEVAIFEYKGSQDYGILKGVDENFKYVTEVDSTIREGDYILKDRDRHMAILGVGMRNKLSVNVDDYFSAISVYMAKKKQRKSFGGLSEPFTKRYLYPAGTFVIQQDFDSQYIISSLEFAQELISSKGEVSSMEIKLKDGVPAKASVKAIENILGEGFDVKDRYRQDEAFLKLMNIEKWMSFAILSLTLLLIAFNLIGALWMIVLEKKQDIAILKSMGATDIMVRNIFLGVGLLLCLLGVFLGFFIAISLYLIQVNFGIVPIPDGFVINSYPISMRFFDFLIVGVTVIIIGAIASIPPAKKAESIESIIRKE